VANVLRAWLDVHFMPDEDEPMLDKVEQFAHQKMVDAVGSEMLKMLAKTLLNIIARRVSLFQKSEIKADYVAAKRRS
jgi:hypothetical protein